MEPGGQPATSLSPENPKFPQKVREILLKAQNAWLKNTEVCDLLLHYSDYNLPVARDPPNLPPGMGSAACVSSCPRRFEKAISCRITPLARGIALSL